jgi:hypothetical protein
MTRISGILREYQYTFMTISRSVPLRMKNISEKGCRENHNTHFMLNNFLSKIVLFMKSCGKIL